MRALGEQRDKNHQVRQGKQPLIRLVSSNFRRASDKAEMAALGEIVDVIHTDAGEAGNFRIGEDLLARLHGNHGLAPELFHRFTCPTVSQMLVAG